MKDSQLTSHFDEGFFGFIFWRRLHTLTSYFDEGYIFSLKNNGFTTNFIFWRRFLWLCILTKASHFDSVFWRRLHFLLRKMQASQLTLYFDEDFFSFVFWWRLHTLTSYFDEGFGFSPKSKGLTTNFIFWCRFLWVCILMLISLASYFNECYTL
jgi:hypothetical protein